MASCSCLRPKGREKVSQNRKTTLPGVALVDALDRLIQYSRGAPMQVTGSARTEKSSTIAEKTLHKVQRVQSHALLRRLRGVLLNVWCIWKTAFRSFRGHIQIQSTKVFPYTDFGLALRRLPDGRLLPDERTESRSSHTSRLEAKYPWVDAVDRQLFLLGFDAGEQWGLGIRDTELHKRAE